MTSVPPPYSSRDHAQAQPGPQSSNISSSSPTQEFSETTSVCLEWKITGLKSMYEGTRGEQKSKCVKSAVFGDVDTTWETLFYANSGASNQTAGDHVSLYLSCVPTSQERNSKLAGQWTRKGLWWFKFEIRPAPTAANPKPDPIASKDASDHTFAVKTANWGWQAFAKRDLVFLHPSVMATDSFVIVCTIQAQPQPPAGFWLGVGLQPGQGVGVNTRGIGSGGGLSAWSTEHGYGGVAGGTTAGGGARKVVPKDLITSVGSLLDDPLYSDVEFIIPSRRGTPPKKIYAIKKMLERWDYFEAMFNGGFGEEERAIDEDDDYNNDELDILSDSDMGDENGIFEDEEAPVSPELGGLTTTTSRASSTPPLNQHRHIASSDFTGKPEAGDDAGEKATIPGGLGNPVGIGSRQPEGNREGKVDEEGTINKEVRDEGGTAKKKEVLGPKKTRVVIRDSAWCTWWALLYWIYTDVIYFAPLSSSFEHDPKNMGATAPDTDSEDPQTRLDWIHQWMAEHDIDLPPDPSSSSALSSSFYELHLGPRPVSAKSIYRLADKLGLLPLKLRAFQHICGQLTARNVPAEVFSRFSSTFEDVRKVEVACFLKNWDEIKKSETMMQIWKNIRHGKHVGFEEGKSRAIASLVRIKC